MSSAAVTVDGLSGLSVTAVLWEVADRFLAGAPIHPAAGLGTMGGMVSADPDTLATLADAIEARADWFERENIHPACDCRRMRRDADRVRRYSEDAR